jgi:hypothetical protein
MIHSPRLEGTLQSFVGESGSGQGVTALSLFESIQTGHFAWTFRDAGVHYGYGGGFQHPDDHVVMTGPTASTGQCWARIEWLPFGSVPQGKRFAKTAPVEYKWKSEIKQLNSGKAAVLKITSL